MTNILVLQKREVVTNKPTCTSTKVIEILMHIDAVACLVPALSAWPPRTPPRSTTFWRRDNPRASCLYASEEIPFTSPPCLLLLLPFLEAAFLHFSVFQCYYDVICLTYRRNCGLFCTTVSNPWFRLPLFQNERVLSERTGYSLAEMATCFPSLRRRRRQDRHSGP